MIDTVNTPTLLKIVQAEKLGAKQLITHRFALAEILDTYETFAQASKTKALKVNIEVLP